MKKVVNRYELVEGARIQTAADLDIVPGQQSHCSSVLLLKHVPLQRRAEQQEVVICRQKRTEMGVTEEEKKINKIRTWKINSQNMNKGLGLMAKSGI